MSRRAFARLILLAALASPARAVEAGEPALAVPADAPEQTIFDWDSDRCAKTDIPDAPPRAFRDDGGQVHLIATHLDNRAFVGPDFDHLAHPCAVIYKGAGSATPSAFDDRQWLAAFQTDDGRTIHALVHNEFQGDTHPGLCPSGKYMACWYNAITYAVSTDGGATFAAPAAPGNVVVAPPVPYRPDAGKPVGYFQPTNIVRGRDGAFYFMFLVSGVAPGGVCVARSTDIADPASWRAWDGTGFSARLAGAYAGGAPASCKPVGDGALFEIGSLTFDRVSGRFVYLGGISVGAGDKWHPRGAYYATSADLITWSKPVRLFTSPQGRKVRYGFFSLIDEASPARDFSEIGGYGDLFLYYVKFDQKRQPYARTLVKTKVELAPAP